MRGARISVAVIETYAESHLYCYMYLKSYFFGPEGPPIPYRFIFS